MELFLGTTVDGVQMGLCFAILALGVYISYSILNFPDLSVDGVFPLGGVFATILMLKCSLPAPLAVLLAFAAGFAAGALTGFLHERLHISDLLSGIIVMTALLSVNLAATRLLTRTGMTTTIFSYRSENLNGLFGGGLFDSLSGEARDFAMIAVLLAIVLAVKIIIDLLLKTKFGYLLKATGSNERLVVSLGKDSARYKIWGLAISDGFVAVSGAVYASLYSSYDGTCGTGKMVLAIASVIIGTVVFSRIRFFKSTTAVILGALIYSLCLNYLVLVDTDGIYLKLLNAVLFTFILLANNKIQAFLTRKGRNPREGGKRQ